MAEMKHTPGPWAYRDGMILAAGDWIDETGKKRRDFTYPVVIAHVPDSWDQSRNGNLLAAAPEAINALQALLAKEKQRYAATDAGRAAFEHENADAIAIIAKAEGRSNA